MKLIASLFFLGLVVCGVALCVHAQTPTPSPAAVAAAASGGVLSWIVANWQNLLLAILAIDAALIPLFPNSGLLVTIKNILSGLTNKTS